jgi:hypothetical protein
MKVMRYADETKDSATIAYQTLQLMTESEIVRQGAEKLGITASKDEINDRIENFSLPNSEGFRSYYSNEIIVHKVKNNYFGPKVPESDTQVHPLIMMLESDERAIEVRERLVNGDNFTMLASEFGQDYYSKNINQGDFGWHPRDILKDRLSSTIPLDYAFSAEVGTLSEPLSDNETNKQLGYWLIRLVDRPEEGKVHVKALVVSDNATGMDVKARLENGTLSLADAVEKYNSYSLSAETAGDFGVIDISENSTYTDAFNAYVFNPDTPTGQWSQPVVEKELWTQGGSWLVQVIGREDNREISQEDRDYIIDREYDNWYSELTSDPDLVMESDLLTDEMRQGAIDRLDKELPQTQQVQTQ